MVIERFSDLAGQWPSAQRPPAAWSSAGRANGGGRPGAGGPSAPGASSSLQADAERAVDAYLNVVRRLYDVVAGFAPPVANAGGTGAEPLRLPPTSPGGTTSAYAWLHNTTREAVTALVPRAADLVDHHDHRILGVALSFDPGTVARLEPGASSQLLATLRVPVDAVPGTYHGLVLVEHLEDVALHVVVEVRPSDDDRA
jgi:hypothetical protein